MNNLVVRTKIVKKLSTETVTLSPYTRISDSIGALARLLNNEKTGGGGVNGVIYFNAWIGSQDIGLEPFNGKFHFLAYQIGYTCIYM